MASYFDYAEFIETMNELDTDTDYYLTQDQFQTLLQKIPISNDPKFIDLAYKSLSNENGINFCKVRTLYEASFRGMKNRSMCHIMYRVVDEDKDKFITIDQFKLLYRIVNPNAEDCKMNEMINKLTENHHGKISYQQVALHIFGFRARSKENPFKDEIFIPCPYTGCCEVA